MVVVKKFYGTWCGPCKMLNPVFNDLKNEFNGVTFNDIDIDENKDEVMKYNITSIPVVIVEKDGEVLNRFTGLTSKMAYTNAINEALK